MQFIIIRLSVCLLVCVALVSCETLDAKRKVDYKSASSRTLPPLDVPPDLAAIPQGNSADGTAPSTATYSEFAIDKKTFPGSGQSATLLPEIPEIRIER